MPGTRTPQSANIETPTSGVRTPQSLGDVLSQPYIEEQFPATNENNSLGLKVVNAENINTSVIYYSIQQVDNFDSTHNFSMKFRIPRDAVQIISVTADIYSQLYRSFAINQTHSHTASIGGHNHDVSVVDHTHTVSITDHSHSMTHTHGVSGSNHSHTLTINVADSSAGTALKYRNSGSPSLTCVGNAGNLAFEAGNLADATTPGSVTSGSSSSSTTANGGATSPTSAAGGAQTVTSATAGSTITTTDTQSGLTYGIFEDTYPQNLNLLVDTVNVSTALGGTWSPATTTAHRELTNLNLTPYVVNNSVNNGIHTLELSSTQNGRAIVQLYIKCIVKN